MDGRLGSDAGGAAARELAGRLAVGVPGGRLAETVALFSERLHSAVSELALTEPELQAAIAFLTEVGQACDGRRQEWVLLADVLGISAQVVAQSEVRPVGATSATLRGPFYRPGAPMLPLGASTCLDGKGVPLAVHLSVTGLDGRPVPGALVETWQANGDGRHENEADDDGAMQPEWNLRGRFRSDAEGRLWYRAVRPGGYGLPEGGPVHALAQKLGLPLRRPAHLSFRISAAGHRDLVTHLFDADDPDIGRDAIFGVRPDLIVRFQPDGPGWRLDYTFVLVPAGAGKPPGG
jgi:hydroxyquinol 1,2-dioxygenase